MFNEVLLVQENSPNKSPNQNGENGKLLLFIQNFSTLRISSDLFDLNLIKIYSKFD